MLKARAQPRSVSTSSSANRGSTEWTLRPGSITCTMLSSRSRIMSGDTAAASMPYETRPGTRTVAGLVPRLVPSTRRVSRTVEVAITSMVPVTRNEAAASRWMDA